MSSRWVAVHVDPANCYDADFRGPYDCNIQQSLAEQYRLDTSHTFRDGTDVIVPVIAAAPQWLCKWLTREQYCSPERIHIYPSDRKVSFTVPVNPEAYSIVYLLGLAATGWSCPGVKVAKVERTWDTMGLHTVIHLEEVE